MKLSQLILEATQILKKEGDLETTAFQHEEEEPNIQVVSSLRVSDREFDYDDYNNKTITVGKHVHIS